MTQPSLPAKATSTTDSAKPATATSRIAGRGLSIQLRLLALVAATAVPALLFSMLQVRAANLRARENAEQTALELARRIATRIDDHVSVVNATLLTLGRVVGTSAA